MRDGGHGASRLGFRGSEDLGGGLRANFVLEAGINGPTGQGTLPGPGLAFTRQSAVGLSGSWGRVDAGRMYTPVFYQLVRADVFDVNGVFSQLNLIGQKDGQSGTSAFAFRTNRIIRYRSPEAENLVLDMAYAFGEASESSGGSGKSLGGSIGWNQGPVYVGYSFQKYHTATGQAPTSTPSVSKFQVFSGSFRVTDTVRLSGNYIHTSSKYPTPSANLINFGASWNVGLSRFLASAIQRKVDASARSQVGWTLGYDYMLSKRTLLYARVLHLNNRHGASATIAGIEVSPNSGDNVSLSGIGIRHNF